MKKFLSCLLAAVMLIGLMGVGVYAEDSEWTEESVIQSDEDMAENDEVNFNEENTAEPVDDETAATQEEDIDISNSEDIQETEELNADIEEVSEPEESETTSEEEESENIETPKYSIVYTSHVQKIGWQSAVSDGEMSGTTGNSYRLEGIKIYVEQETEDGSEIIENAVDYRVHVQKIGWQSAVSDGAMAGTSGQSLRLEAIEITPGEAISSDYDIYYRVHAQHFGWLGWAKNGETAGTSGLSYRLEAIEIKLVEKGSSDAPSQDSISYCTSTQKGLITYQTHVQTYGWQTSVADGEVAGTQGESKRVEAIKIWINNPKDEGGNIIEGSVSYQTHVQTYGWQDEVTEGEMAGTSGESKRVEAIKISLTGDLAEYYDIYYRVHCQTYGTLDWAKNGEIAGTVGCSKRVESIEIAMYKKGDSDAPTQSGRSYLDKDFIGDISYQSYIQGTGWQDAVGSGEVSGLESDSTVLESMKFTVDNSSTGDYSGSIEYKVHVATDGWLDAVSDGAEAGTTDSGYAIQAISINLTDELEDYCDIYYSARVQEYGWLGWAKNGQTAGTTGCGYNLEAIKVVIVPKGTTAPGSNSGYYYTYKKNDIRSMDSKMYNKIIGLSSSTSYLIAVDAIKNKVGIFTGSKGNWNLLYYWDCTTGSGETPTIKGEFTVSDKGLCFSGETNGTEYTCWYWTRISGDYLFHSVLYSKGSQTEIVDGRLGMSLSHGCVRLALENAKWIYDNIPVGTKIIIYS